MCDAARVGGGVLVKLRVAVHTRVVPFAAVAVVQAQSRYSASVATQATLWA